MRSQWSWSFFRLAVLPALVGVLGILSVAVALADQTTDGPAAGGTRGFGMARSIFGDILADNRGFAVYTWDGDDRFMSNCYGECAAQFPPFLVNTRRPQGSGFNASFGVVVRADGTLQATADGWPLYYFSGDTGPGSANGNGAPGGWWILNYNPQVLDPPD